MSSQLIFYLVLALAAASAILGIEAAYLSFAGRRAKVGTINRRLKRLADDAPAEQTLQNLLRERGLTEEGNFAFGAIWLNQLYTQSGITGSPVAFGLTFLSAGTVLALALRTLLSVSLLVSLLVFVAVALILPVLVLRRARRRRIAKFEGQLPDALDMIVRSLRAGHPASVTVAMVAREMPDPIGTEFGIVSDEVTFGLSLEQAVRKLSERVGFEGLHLLSVSLSIQAKTGGNLTDILANLSKVLRERRKLRMKIRSLSAEGRLSAIMISLFPLVMFGILALIAPSYYGDVWGKPVIVPTFTIFGAWALLGDYIMYRMVNFDF
ncbi:type II secretion system F family protein [Mesorhizobium sp. KR9-304]|uniref:type II secretion system F family protein n=1 Tax=Mesorhizobium sp. KR9-304 TaxID=3156614 RepID=UPI0032B3F4EC